MTDFPTLREEIQYGLPRLITIVDLPQTQRVITALAHQVNAEAHERGFDPDTLNNPLDDLTPNRPAGPFIARMGSAIRLAQTAHAFDAEPDNEPAPAPSHPWPRGTRVRMFRRPADEVALPGYVTVGATGTINSHDPFGNPLGDGYYVDFDVHGNWWTTTDTLELI